MRHTVPAKTQYQSNDVLLSDNVELVKRIAYHLVARLPASVDVNDLIQAGMIGLLEASRKFDASKGASFATFAGIRIRGAMIDEQRRHDWTPRSVHVKRRRVMRAVHKIEGEKCRPAESREIAAHLGLEIDDYHDIVADASGSLLLSLDEAVDSGTRGRDMPTTNSKAPDDEVQETQFRQQLAASIMQLTERERLVLSLYYEQDLSLREIATVLEVSESRVCQIRRQAEARLREMIAPAARRCGEDRVARAV